MEKDEVLRRLQTHFCVSQRASACQSARRSLWAWCWAAAGTRLRALFCRAGVLCHEQPAPASVRVQNRWVSCRLSRSGGARRAAGANCRRGAGKGSTVAQRRQACMPCVASCMAVAFAREMWLRGAFCGQLAAWGRGAGWRGRKRSTGALRGTVHLSDGWSRMEIVAPFVGCGLLELLDMWDRLSLKSCWRAVATRWPSRQQGRMGHRSALH